MAASDDAARMDELVQILMAVLSSDNDTRDHAAAALDAASAVPGFLAMLLHIVHTADIDYSVRFSAAINFKNTAAATWRPTPSLVGVSEEERIYLRSHLEAFLDLDDDKLAVHMALSLARIARCDVPHVWPELIPALLGLVRDHPHDGSSLAFSRGLLALLHVVDALAGRRLSDGRSVFSDLAVEAVPVLCAIYADLIAVFMEFVASGGVGVSDEASAWVARSLEQALLAHGTVCLLVTHGLDRFDEVEAVMTFLSSQLEHLKAAALCQDALPPAHPIACGALQYMLSVSDSISLLLVTKPHGFISLLHPYLAFFHALFMSNVEAPQPLSPGRARCLLLSLHFMAEVEDVPAFRETRTIGAAATGRIAAFWTDERLAAATEAIVTTVLPLSESDLTEWQDAPEQFILRSEGQSHEVDAGAAGAHLLGLWLRSHRDQMGPLVLGLLDAAQSLPTDSLRPVLLRDAVYETAGLAFWELGDALPFCDWLSTQLVHEAQTPGPGLALVQRRVAWLIEAWVFALKEPAMRELCYGLLLALLEGDDLVVALTAVKTLRVLIQDVDFEPRALSPFAKGLLTALFRLWERCETSDCRLRALNAITVVLSVLGPAVGELALEIASALPALWTAVLPYDDLKAAMLLTTVAVVAALGPRVVEIYSFVLPVIEYASSPRNADSVFLVDEAMELWEAVMGSGVAIGPELVAMVPQLCDVMRTGFGDFRASLAVAKGYLLAGDGAEAVWAEHGEVLAETLLWMVHAASTDEGLVVPVECIELCIRACPEAAPPHFDEFLGYAVRALLAGSIQTALAVRFLLLLSRLCIHNGAAFEALLASVSEGAGEDVGPLLLDVLLARWDAISRAEWRRVAAMAAVAMLCRGDDAMLARFGGVVSAVTGALCEVSGGAGGGRRSTAVVEGAADVALSVPLDEFVRARFRAIEVGLGPERWAAAVAALDGYLLSMLDQLLRVG